MAAPARIDVINRDGWRREFPVTKSIIHVGSDPNNDIVLDPAYGAGVSPRHLIPVAGSSTFRAVNMSAENLVLDEAGLQVVAPHTFVDLAPGQQVKLGEFTLIVKDSGAAPVAAAAGSNNSIPSMGSPFASHSHPLSTSHVINVQLNLPNSKLTPSNDLNGSVTIINAGDQTGVQFNIAIEGLDSEFYEIGPGPILFPGAEKDVVFRISHSRKPQPAAGQHEILVHVTAPGAYPGETVTVSQILEIQPYYNHRVKMRLLED